MENHHRIYFNGKSIIKIEEGKTVLKTVLLFSYDIKIVENKTIVLRVDFDMDTVLKQVMFLTLGNINSKGKLMKSVIRLKNMIDSKYVSRKFEACESIEQFLETSKTLVSEISSDIETTDRTEF